MILDANDKIWSYAELPYEETRSSALLCSILESEGFTVETGVAEIPTAFVARYVVGTGKPVMGILGEFDALATLSQKAGCTVKDPVQNGGSGHGCGHCCLGTGALAAALAVKEYLVQNQKDGTIIYYGCAAEEGQERNSLWPEPDYLTVWILYTHGIPADRNEVQPTCSVAIMGANFEFFGRIGSCGSLSAFRKKCFGCSGIDERGRELSERAYDR